ncbi:LysR family transcriptional regulator [Kineococcus sp. GCM10028916]|uniref:LysR family transcriptional regulator n=1 Tax=Kineococcus sp. GCM10028916 TaxID=3273394 RepID=UPI003636E40F
MTLTFSQLRIFALAARHGSFTAAGRALQMSQPTVSEAIRRLEQGYGTKLFVRGARHLILTTTGEELLPLAEQAVTAVDAADQALTAVQELKGGVASFGLLRNAKHYAMADLLTSFHENYPDVRLRVIGVNSADVADLVRTGELEAGLIVLPVDTEGLTVRPLTRDEVVYVTASLDRDDTPVTIEELSSTDLILYDAHAGWRDPTRRQVEQRALAKGLTLRARIEVEQVDAALELAAAGAGNTFVSRAVVDSGTAPPALRYIPFEEPLYDTIALVRRDGGVLSPATRELVRLAREMLTRRALEP